MLLALGQPDAAFRALDRTVAAAALPDRQAAYLSDAVQRAIAISVLTPAEQLALSTTLAEGSLRWARGASVGDNSDFYVYFGVNDAQGPPPPMTKMACYELILYQAWRLGQITTEWIVKRYDSGPLADTPSYEGMGFSPDLPILTDAAGAGPAVGDRVFISFPEAAKPWHAVLALGGDEAMSLWKYPTPETPGTRVKLSGYVARGERVQYGPPSWQ